MARSTLAPASHRHPRRIALLTSAALLLAPLPLWAQEPEFLGTITLDPAQARAQDPDGNAADRANSQYVAEAELDRARMGNLKDLFAGIASVSVGGGIPIAQKIFVNGVDMLNLAVSVDGVSQNNRVFHHVSANAFDPGLMRFVRVDAGAAPADAGPHALAGAVVMETVKATDILDDGKTFGGNTRLSYSDNGKTAQGSTTLAGRMGGFEWLGYFKRATGDDYETGAGDVIAGSAADMTTKLVKLAYETAEGHRFELSGQQMVDDAIRPFRANFVDEGSGRPPRRYDTDRRTYALSYENTQASGLWDPRVVIGHSEVDILVGGNLPGFNKTNSIKIENRFHLSADNSVTVGVDYYDKESYYDRGGPDEVGELSENVGIYAQARLDPIEKLSLSFGLRWDQQDFTGTNGWEGDFSGLSGNLSVSYQATDALKLRAGVSSVFGGLALEDNFIYNPAWSYDTIRDSRATNYTLGADYEIGDLTLEAEVFQTKIDDARFAMYAATRNGNADVESRGFNLGLGYGWDQGYQRASYSYSKLKVDGAPTDTYTAGDLGAPLGGVFAIEAQHTPDGSDFTFGGSVEAALAYDELAVDANRGIPGYAVLNLFTEYNAPSIEGLTIRAEVSNIFDKEYADRATYGQDYDTVLPLYEPGRSVSLIAAIKF